MDGSVGAIVSMGSERRVALVPLDKDGVIFWLSVQIPLKKPMATLEVSYQWDDKRRVRWYRRIRMVFFGLSVQISWRKVFCHQEIAHNE